MWQAVLGLLAGGLILIVSSEKAVDQLINLAKIIGLNIFTIGFIVASIGSDLPETKIFVCSVCGNIVEGSAPDKCPVCGAAKEQFKETL